MEGNANIHFRCIHFYMNWHSKKVRHARFFISSKWKRISCELKRNRNCERTETTVCQHDGHINQLRKLSHPFSHNITVSPPWHVPLICYYKSWGACNIEQCMEKGTPDSPGRNPAPALASTWLGLHSCMLFMSQNVDAHFFPLTLVMEPHKLLEINSRTAKWYSFCLRTC